MNVQINGHSYKDNLINGQKLKLHPIIVSLILYEREDFGRRMLHGTFGGSNWCDIIYCIIAPLGVRYFDPW